MQIQDVARWALEGAVLAGVVALLCALVPRIRAHHRALLWWLVSAKLLVGLIPLPAVHVEPPSFARFAAEAPAAVAAMVPSAVPAPMIPTAALLKTAWLAAVALLVAASIPGWRRVRRWRRLGRPLDDDDSRAAIARACRVAGLRRAPQVLAVAALPAPLVTGLLRPAVLLPAESLAGLAPDELAMTLAHEMSHIARGDLWLGLVPALARRVFFFHPAAWIAEREHAIAREAACDEIVLGREGADPYVYGRLLVRVATRRPIRTAIPMARHSMLRRRLLMIESLLRRTPLGRAGWAFVALVALAIVPVRLLAKDAVGDRCLEIGSGQETAYVITDGRSHSMCGDIADVQVADKARRGGEDVVWFRANGHDWVIRDAAFVTQARRLFAGVGEIGAQQAAIGEKQAKIGQEQAAIGSEQGAIGLRQAEVAMTQAQIELRRAAELDAERVRRAQVEEELAQQQQAERAQVEKSRQDARSAEALAERMQELQQRQAAFGHRQADFGEKQAQLAEQIQREVATAQRALSQLLERAMRDGTAERAD